MIDILKKIITSARDTILCKVFIAWVKHYIIDEKYVHTLQTINLVLFFVGDTSGHFRPTSFMQGLNPREFSFLLKNKHATLYVCECLCARMKILNQTTDCVNWKKN